MKYLILFFFLCLSTCIFPQSLGLGNVVQKSSVTESEAPTPPAPPEGYEFFITVEGDTFLTVEGDTFYVLISFNYNLLQIKRGNGNENIKIHNYHVHAVIPNRKRTA